MGSNKVQELKRMNKNELISLLEQVDSKKEMLENALYFEKQKQKAFSDICNSDSIIDYIQEILSGIPIHNTSAIRLIIQNKDFLGNRIIAGFGNDHEQYTYLDSQVEEQLGGKSILKIDDTSKIHNLIFDQYKIFPRSIYAIPIIFSMKKAGFIWISDLKTNAYSEEKIEQITKIISEYELALVFLSEILRQRQLEKIHLGTINSIKDPIILCDPNGEIVLENQAATKEFENNEANIQARNAIKVVIKEKKEKISINVAGREYDGYFYQIEIPAKAGYYFYRFINLTRKKAEDRYLQTIIDSIASNFQLELEQIQGYSTLISGLGGMSEKQEDYIQKVSSVTERLKELVVDLLDFNRIKHNGFISLKEVDSKVILLEIIEKFSPVIRQKKIEIIQDFDDGPISLTTDKEIFCQLLINLFESATQDSPMSGKIAIDLHKNDSNIIFSISDKGGGLSRPDIESIMNKSSKINKTHEHLITARKITDLLQGKMVLESQLGKGKKARIYLLRTIK